MLSMNNWNWLRQAVICSVGASLVIGLWGCIEPMESTVLRPPRISWADSVLSTMNLGSKVAQMIMVDLNSPADISSETQRNAFLRHTLGGRAGGIVLFAGDPLEYAPWIEWIQNQSNIPKLVALDAEWGAGYRMKGMTRFPNAMAIAASGRSQLAYNIGSETARQASTMGISVLFAPVADVLTNPRNPVIGTRAWSDNPDSVALYANAFAKGVQSQGLMPVAKHFPGHGDTFEDSHTNLPISNRSESNFFDVDLKPFRVLINDSIGGIMSAHIVEKGHSFSDPLPSTLSRRLLTDLLRDSLRFEGIIFSDALNMAGVTAFGTSGEVAVQAVIAGIDVLLMPPDPNAAHAALVAAVKDGQISESRIDSSVVRILRAKDKLSLQKRVRFTDLNSILKIVTSKESQDEAWFVGRNAVTILKNEGVLPILEENGSILLISADFRAYSDSSQDPARQLAAALESGSHNSVAHIKLDASNWARYMTRIGSQAENKTTVIFADFIGITPVRNWNRIKFLSELASSKVSTIVLDHASPYAALQTPETVSVHLIGYDASTAMIKATADVLFGMSAASGQLPLQLSDKYPRGFGLKLPQTFASLSSAGSSSMDATVLHKLDAILGAAVTDRAFPAASVAVGRGNNIVKRTDFGQFTYESSRDVNENDVFDLASLTKVIATTTAIMQLYEKGLIDLNRPVADYLPEFGVGGKGSVTIWDLLTHTGGLIPFIPFYSKGIYDGKEVRSRILGDSLSYEPGSKFAYSDFGPITLAWMIERITGEKFSSYTRDHIFIPLMMHHTGFKTVKSGIVNDAVPTEKDTYYRFRTLQGEVHDETAWVLGGTAGHAGLFSNANDLAKFAAMMANDGQMGDHYFLKPETIRKFTTKVNPFGDHTRALGWDTKSATGYSSAGSKFGPRSFGHTGFTGTSFWIDPDTDVFVILLTNRVYPTRNNSAHVPIRPEIANIAFSALQTAHTVGESVAESP
jgi:beta-N-acetylhexosaminidase